MKVHYFQRYNQKENVATANTLLLLSRLYHYSPQKFFEWLKFELQLEDFNPEISFILQEKSKDSIPDAVISQESFKIVVEIKLSDWFYMDQIRRHLSSFEDENHKILLTIASEFMNEKIKDEVEDYIQRINKKNKYSKIYHINTTFEMLADSIYEMIDDRDFEMQAIIDDYYNYCYYDDLITKSDAWRVLRSQPAGTTIEFNAKENLYYDSSSVGFRPHDYLGLYTQKSVQYIGKITDQILAVADENDEIQFTVEKGDIDEEKKDRIYKAIEDGYRYGYELKYNEHRYFFVDNFYKTDFRKISKGGARGSRIFYLDEILNLEELPNTEEIANMLNNHTWS